MCHRVISQRSFWIPLYLRLLRVDPVVRQEFVRSVLFRSPDRLIDLLFECPFPEVSGPSLPFPCFTAPKNKTV